MLCHSCPSLISSATFGCLSRTRRGHLPYRCHSPKVPARAGAQRAHMCPRIPGNYSFSCASCCSPALSALISPILPPQPNSSIPKPSSCCWFICRPSSAAGAFSFRSQPVCAFAPARCTGRQSTKGHLLGLGHCFICHRGV